LFNKPRPIDVIAVAPGGPPHVILWDSHRWEITVARGPERIESGWWQDECVRRDYYRAETTTGRRLWLFRRLQDDHWFWHGEW
jgi:protein ImuB